MLERLRAQPYPVMDRVTIDSGSARVGGAEPVIAMFKALLLYAWVCFHLWLYHVSWTAWRPEDAEGL